MAQQYETGHAKNVARLLELNQLIATFGITYNPNNASITAGAFSTLHNTTNAILINVSTVLNTWKDDTNDREIGFAPLKELSTNLRAALESTNATKQTINDFSFFVRKIRDSKIKSIKKDEENLVLPPIPEEIIKTVSTSQKSFDSVLQHFSKMILILWGVPSYNPNEVQFQLATLQAQLITLTNLNNTANTSRANLTAARIERNLTFYAENTGMLDLVKKCKAYIKSIYGSTSQQYKAATAIKFVRVVSRKKAK